MAKIRWYQSLRWKLFLAYLLVGFLPLLFFANIMSESMENYFISMRENELKRTANIIADRVSQEDYFSEDNNFEDFQLYMYERSIEESLRIIILDNRGIVINDTQEVKNGKTLILPEVNEALSKNNVSNRQENPSIMYTAVPILDEESDVLGVVLTISSLEDIEGLFSIIRYRLRLLNIVTTVIVIIAVFFISQIILVPLKKLLKVVALMSEGQHNQRVSVSGNDEFAMLCIAFNEMNEKLEKVEKTREEFVSNVSHELKTPLSSMKVLSESILLQENVPIEMYIEFLQDINSEIDRMTFIVNDLLTLVRLDQKVIGLNIKDTDINKVIEDIIKRLKPLADKNNIKLLYENIKNINIKCDEMKISLAISNLVENGIKYTEDGGSVKITLDADHKNIFIKIADTGVGIAEEEQNKIFTRFYRIDKTRDRGTGGTGLGLSITHSTVLLHNGSIRINSKEGEGTTFVVRLPINYQDT